MLTDNQCEKILVYLSDAKIKDSDDMFFQEMSLINKIQSIQFLIDYEGGLGFVIWGIILSNMEPSDLDKNCTIVWKFPGQFFHDFPLERSEPIVGAF